MARRRMPKIVTIEDNELIRSRGESKERTNRRHHPRHRDRRFQSRRTFPVQVPIEGMEVPPGPVFANGELGAGFLLVDGW